MHETMEKVKKICSEKDKLISMLECQRYEIDSEAGSKIVDEIKDLASAEKDCWEACYYKKMVEALSEFEEEDEGRKGYNHRHYANGQFAPSGRGHIVYGYPMSPMNQSYDRDGTDGRMGYRPEDLSSGRGESYNQYQTSKKHYTESHSMTDKNEMDRNAMKHVMDTVSSAKEIWEDADPGLKSQMKNEFSKLASVMGL